MSLADEVVVESPPLVYSNSQCVIDAFAASGYNLADLIDVSTEKDLVELIPDYPTAEFVLLSGRKLGASLEEIAAIYTLLEDCVDYSINPEDESRANVKAPRKSRVTSAFGIRVVYAPFYSPTKRSYRYVMIEIKASRVKAAGMGAYTATDLRQGEFGFYRGEVKSATTHNHAYAWEMSRFRSNGKAIGGKAVSYLDATDDKHANWARYVNCANFDFKNNMGMCQSYFTCRYEALRDIDAGEELFIDYGEGYRDHSLGFPEATYGLEPTCWECGGEVEYLPERLDFYAHANYFYCALCDEKMVWCDLGLHTLGLGEKHHTNRDLATVICDGCEDAEDLDNEDTIEDPSLIAGLED